MNESPGKRVACNTLPHCRLPRSSDPPLRRSTSTSCSGMNYAWGQGNGVADGDGVASLEFGEEPLELMRLSRRPTGHTSCQRAGFSISWQTMTVDGKRVGDCCCCCRPHPTWFLLFTCSDWPPLGELMMMWIKRGGHMKLSSQPSQLNCSAAGWTRQDQICQRVERSVGCGSRFYPFWSWMLAMLPPWDLLPLWDLLLCTMWWAVASLLFISPPIRDASIFFLAFAQMCSEQNYGDKPRRWQLAENVFN